MVPTLVVAKIRLNDSTLMWSFTSDGPGGVQSAHPCIYILSHAAIQCWAGEGWSMSLHNECIGGCG